jgi:hypothetical protein
MHVCYNPALHKLRKGADSAMIKDEFAGVVTQLPAGPSGGPCARPNVGGPLDQMLMSMTHAHSGEASEHPSPFPRPVHATCMLACVWARPVAQAMFLPFGTPVGHRECHHAMVVVIVSTPPLGEVPRHYWCPGGARQLVSCRTATGPGLDAGSRVPPHSVFPRSHYSGGAQCAVRIVVVVVDSRACSRWGMRQLGAHSILAQRSTYCSTARGPCQVEHWLNRPVAWLHAVLDSR